jgi:hypothetical protein
MKLSILTFSLATLLIIRTPGAQAQITADLETGVVFSGYNDVRIPGDSGTLFSLSEELEADPVWFGRVRLSYRFNERHSLSILIAPLTINSAGSLDRSISFEGVDFPANTPLTSTYTFNSYRLTYRYDFPSSGRIRWGLGFTAKIRDALIEIKGGGLSSKKLNLGFVPIINGMFEWEIKDRLFLLIEGDALAAPQGRAEDIFLGFRHTLDPERSLLQRLGLIKQDSTISLKGGYRILEGGADVDEVYTFALINYLSIGMIIQF